MCVLSGLSKWQESRRAGDDGSNNGNMNDGTHNSTRMNSKGNDGNYIYNDI